LSGAREEGAETEIFYVGELDVHPWTGEDIQDDMQLIFRAVEGADAIVFGTPIYHDHVTAQAKIVTDRFAIYEDERRLPEGMRLVIVITYYWDNPNGYDYVVESIRQTFKRYFGAETFAVLKAHGTKKRPVSENPELLREAKAIGRKLAKITSIST
jgi:multimeric flavodoxin WrbA